MSEAERKTFADLQWPHIERAVAERCRGPLRESLELQLADSFSETERSLAESREAWDLLQRGEPLPIEGVCAISASLEHLNREGVLDAAGLRDIRRTLQAASKLRKFLSQRKALLPYLHHACSTDPSLDSLEEEIGMSVDVDGSILDSASADLGRLRQEVSNLRARIVGRLEEILRKRSAILQDSFYTLREGRYVLPVRADAHERLHGIVHGASASGATIFVEPRELVERGNRLKMAQAELEREERRILAALSDLVRQYVPQMGAVVAALNHADLKAASARLAKDLDGCFAELTPQARVRLVSGRHPLLALAGGPVVANDLELNGGNALVISGPNAGGKTVALKMLGLAALMTRAGLPLSAGEGSQCGFFSPVLAAVGDEQSLERSLSTFSAHLVTLRAVLQQAGERVLILLDELAGATDPEAGSALACAVTEHLIEAGAAVAVTTHYEALKALAAERDDMENASVGFDFEAMEPTFRLVLGVPGGSNALDVARRYGIPDDIVEEARALLPEHSRQFESLVAKLEQAREALLAEQSGLAEERAALGLERKRVEQRAEKLKAREARGLSQEGAELLDRVRSLEAELRSARKALREQPSQEAVREAAAVLEQGSSTLAELERRQRELQPAPVETTALHHDSVAVGDRVWVERLRSVADVIEAPDRGKVRVSAGMMKLWVDLADLRAVKVQPSTDKPGAQQPPQPSRRNEVSKPSIRTLDNTVDVRGLRADEAVALTQAFLDRMYGAAETRAYILHGVGSGALREAIHEHLSREQSYVTDFRTATQDEGGAQVTVVTLK